MLYRNRNGTFTRGVFSDCDEDSQKDSQVPEERHQEPHYRGIICMITLCDIFFKNIFLETRHQIPYESEEMAPSWSTRASKYR